MHRCGYGHMFAVVVIRAWRALDHTMDLRPDAFVREVARQVRLGVVSKRVPYGTS